MAKYSLMMTSVTPSGIADGADLTDGQYFGLIHGASSTQRVKIHEVMLGGQAPSVSSPTNWVLSRDSVLASGVTMGAGLSNALIDASASGVSSPPVVGNVASSKPQRSAGQHLLNLSFNAYGGLVRWLAAPGEEITLVGNSSSLGELSLSVLPGGAPGACGGHIIYEVE